MKKVIVTVFSSFLLCVMAVAKDVIPLSVKLINPKPVGHSTPKSPMQPPTVYIEDFTLYFATDHPDYVLNIKDEDGEVVYTTVVYTAQTQAVLPSTLSGDYEIELVMGNWLFTGCINL